MIVMRGGLGTLFLLAPLLFHLLLLLVPVGAIWTKFDLVRSKQNGWRAGKTHGYGSNGSIAFSKISALHGNGPVTAAKSRFGFSVANVGDINGDGVEDIGVGAIGEDVHYNNSLGTQIQAGGIYILFMRTNGTVESHVHINSVTNNGPPTLANDNFGYSICSIGDLDGDSIMDIAVGAPSYISSSVYILFMERNGSVREHALVRGSYGGNVPSNVTLGENSSTYIPNGPPIEYGSAFGSALAFMGDLDNDTIPDFAASNVDRGLGTSYVYLLFMHRNGTVKRYTAISSAGEGGGPDIQSTEPGTFPRFGISIVQLSDINKDNVTDLAIGASSLSDPGTLNKKSGRVYVCLMNANGTVKSYTRVSDQSGTFMGRPKLNLPSVPYDRCGAALAFMGDINQDDRASRHPKKRHRPRRPSIGDFIMGCPQTDSSGLTGRLMFVYLSILGEIAGHTVSPADTDEKVRLTLLPGDQFGSSLAVMQDWDKNGLRELAVGAPGDDDGGEESTGAVYIMYYRRRRFHPIPFDFVTFILIVTLVPFSCCFLCWVGIAYFFWYFRRRPDPIEIIVKQAGLEINPNRKRPKYVYQEGAVHVDNYTL